MAGDMPVQVRKAVLLLWVSLGLSTLGMAADWGPIPAEDRSFEIQMIVMAIAVTVFQAGLIYFASRRRNWARILLLVLVLLGGITYVLMPVEDEPWWYWASVLGSLTLDGVAIYWLFSNGASGWYRARGATQGAL